MDTLNTATTHTLKVILSVIYQQRLIVVVFVLVRLVIMCLLGCLILLNLLLLLLELLGKCLVLSDARRHDFFISTVPIDIDTYGELWTILSEPFVRIAHRQDVCMFLDLISQTPSCCKNFEPS